MELLYKEEVFAIVGAAMEVHREMSGSGFYEGVYQEAMEIELGLRGVPFDAQKQLPIIYKGRLLTKPYVADLICYGNIIVELKAIDDLTSREEAQVLHYLKATGYRLGLLINFGDTTGLKWKRIIR